MVIIKYLSYLSKLVTQDVGRVPFWLPEKVNTKLDELLEVCIIEEVAGRPSGWISPLVGIPKSDGDVSVSVNMRPANEEII